MKYAFLLLFLFPISLFGQITGKVTDGKGANLSYVNIYLENTYKGTTSNEDGNYRLDITEKGNYSVVFQFLGYTTVKKNITINTFPFELNISMDESAVSLEEVIINTSEDPAYRIIRETIARRKENLDRVSAFTADFYSRGIWRVDSVPKKILGQEVTGVFH